MTEATCLLCGGTATSDLLATAWENRRFLRCPDCGLLFEDPAFFVDLEVAVNDEEVAYRRRFGEEMTVAQNDGEIYKKYEYDYADDMIGDLLEQTTRLLGSAGVSLDGIQLLEVGTASGFLLRSIENAHPTATCIGVDPSPVSRQQAEALGTTTLEGTMETVDLSDFQPFDACVVWGNLMLHEDPVRTLRLVRDMLTDDGVLVADVKNISSSARRLGRGLALSPLKSVGPIKTLVGRSFTNMRYGFTKETFAEALDQAGFKVLSMESRGPRALRFANQHKQSGGLYGKLWRALDSLDARRGEQAWLVATARAK